MELDFTNDVIEKIILKKAILNKKFLSGLIDYFDQRWFENKKVGAIIKLLVAYCKKYNDVPSIKIIKAMIAKKADALGCGSVSELESELLESKNLDLDIESDIIQDNVLRYLKEKGCYFTIVDTSSDVMKHGSVDKCIQRFEKLMKMTFTDKNIGMRYFNSTDMDSHWDYLANPEAKISTGWLGLDDYTNKGIPKDGKFLGLILAQSGLGKSLFLSNMVVNFLKQNLTVVVISLEMSENVYASRFDAHISEDNINTLGRTSKTSREKIESFYKKYPNANLIIKEYPPRSINAIKIDAYLEELRENGIKPDVLVIDYLNLVVPNTKHDNMFEAGLIVSEEIRSLSYKWAIPIMSAVQANSEGMGNADIDMKNVSQSRGIVFTADFIGAIFQKDEDARVGNLNMRLIKNRLGGMVGKVIPFRMNRINLVISDMSYGGGSVSDTQEVQPETESEMLIENISEISSDMEIDL